MDGIGKQAPKLRQECMFLICAQFWIFRFTYLTWSVYGAHGGGAEKRRGSRIQRIGHILTGKLVRSIRAFYGLSRNGEKKMGQERGRKGEWSESTKTVDKWKHFWKPLLWSVPCMNGQCFPQNILVNKWNLSMPRSGNSLSYLAGKSYSSPKEQRLKLLLLLLLVAQQN